MCGVPLSSANSEAESPKEYAVRMARLWSPTKGGKTASHSAAEAAAAAVCAAFSGLLLT